VAQAGSEFGRPSLAHQAADGGVDLRRMPARIELGLGEHRAPDDLGRVVALMRDADDAISEPERADDLGRARQQGRDALRHDEI
jgi:hypothetical protein